MKKRTAAVLIVLALVLGGGLLTLQLAGQGHAPGPSPAIAKQPEPPAARPPARPSPPAMPSRSQAVQNSDPDSGVIDGSVINGMTHEGIPNAELTFVGDGGVSTFRTGRDGSFELTPAASGSFLLASITAPGFLPYSTPVGFSAARLTLARGQAVHGVTLLLYPADDYEGTVVDARGAPVAAARVRLLDAQREQVLEPAPEWKTGPDGRFTFQAADGAVLEASRGAVRGWAHIDRNVVIMKKLTIRLGHAPPRDATITGWVRDAGGAPLGDALVRAAPSAYYNTAPTVVATTASDGSFTLAGVDRAAYDVSAEAEDHLQVVRAKVLGGSRNVELTLDTGLSIAGQVIDSRGEPVPSFTLVVQRQVGLARAAVATLAVIDPQGRFTVRVASGDYDLIASVPQQTRTAVQATAGAADVRIVIGSGRILRGRVISSEDGTPIAEAFVGPQIVSSGLNAAAVIPVAATRGDGTFELLGLSSGALAIEIRARGYAPKVQELPPVRQGEPRDPITIELSGGGPDRQLGGPDRQRGGDINGIGIQLVPENDALRIVHVMPGSGALDAGLNEGDLIVAVEGVPVATLGVDGAIARIRGPAGTSVTLTLRRDGHDSRLAVERRQLHT